MKKRYMFLCLALALAMTACGSSSSTASTEAAEDTSAAAETETAESTEAVETAAETAADAETETAADAAAAANAAELEVDTPMTVGDSELLLHFEEADDESSLTLSYGGQDLKINDYVEYPLTSYVLTEDDGSFLVFAECGYSNDWVETVPVTWTAADGLTAGETITGAVDADYPVSADAVTLSTRVDILGTYGCTLSCRMENGSLVLTDQYYDFHNVADETIWADTEDYDEDSLEYMHMIFAEDGRRILTTKEDIQAKTEDGSDVTVPAGNVIYPEGVSLADNTFCFTYDDQACTLAIVTDDDYIHLAEGDENEMFETLPYAG